MCAPVIEAIDMHTDRKAHSKTYYSCFNKYELIGGLVFYVDPSPSLFFVFIHYVHTNVHH